MRKTKTTPSCMLVIIVILVAIQGVVCASSNIEKPVRGNDEALAAFQSSIMFWSDVSSYGANIGAGISKSDFLFKTGDKIEIVLATHNLSAEPIAIVLSKVNSDYQVIVSDESGNSIPLTDYGQRMAINAHEFGRVIFKPLKPNDVYLDMFPLNEFYDLTKPGLYSISVTRDIWRFGILGNNDKIHHEIRPIWIAIDDGSIQKSSKLSLAKQLAKKLSTSKTPNAMVSVQSAFKGYRVQVKWTTGLRLAVLSAPAFNTAICANSSILILGSTRVKMTQNARMIGDDLCLPQDGVAAINDYLSLHNIHMDAR